MTMNYRVIHTFSLVYFLEKETSDCRASAVESYWSILFNGRKKNGIYYRAIDKIEIRFDYKRPLTFWKEWNSTVRQLIGWLILYQNKTNKFHQFALVNLLP